MVSDQWGLVYLILDEAVIHGYLYIVLNIFQILFFLKKVVEKWPFQLEIYLLAIFQIYPSTSPIPCLRLFCFFVF